MASSVTTDAGYVVVTTGQDGGQDTAVSDTLGGQAVVVSEKVETVICMVSERGPAGVDGGSARFTQSTPAAVWVINHNLGVRPSVTLLSVGGAEMEASVVHTSENQAVATFLIPVAGSATCS